MMLQSNISFVSWLSSIPLCVCTTSLSICLSVHLLNFISHLRPPLSWPCLHHSSVYSDVTLCSLPCLSPQMGSQQTFSYSTCFKTVGHMVSVTATHLCLVAQSSHGQYEHTWAAAWIQPLESSFSPFCEWSLMDSWVPSTQTGSVCVCVCVLLLSHV